MITEISMDALAMTRRMKEAAESGDADLQLHWARELEIDALLRGATGELSTEIEFSNDGEDGINGTIIDPARALSL